MAFLDSVFLQAHVWSASLGSCGFCHKGRTAGPASRPLLRQTQAGAPVHPGKRPCHAGKSPFDHLISQHVSQGWNLSRLGQQDTPSLPFGPVQSECSQSCLRIASSHFCLCQAFGHIHQPLLPQNSHWPPHYRAPLRASHPRAHGAGAPGTQTEWMGFPWHGVGSHETSSQGNLALLFLSPKNVL